MSLLQILLSLVLGVLGAVLIIGGTIVRYRFALADTRLAVSILVLIFSLLGVGAACIFGTQVVQLLTTGVSTQGTIVDVVSCGSKGNVSQGCNLLTPKGFFIRSQLRVSVLLLAITVLESRFRSSMFQMTQQLLRDRAVRVAAPWLCSVLLQA